MARTQQQFERVADEALHATTNQVGVDGCAEEEGKYFEFPRQVRQRRWFYEMPFACTFVFHTLFKTVITKMIDCGGSFAIHPASALVCVSCQFDTFAPLVPYPHKKRHHYPYFAEDQVGGHGVEDGGK